MHLWTCVNGLAFIYISFTFNNCQFIFYAITCDTFLAKSWMMFSIMASINLFPAKSNCSSVWIVLFRLNIFPIRVRKWREKTLLKEVVRSPMVQMKWKQIFDALKTSQLTETRNNISRERWRKWRQAGIKNQWQASKVNGKYENAEFPPHHRHHQKLKIAKQIFKIHWNSSARVLSHSPPLSFRFETLRWGLWMCACACAFVCRDRH